MPQEQITPLIFWPVDIGTPSPASLIFSVPVAPTEAEPDQGMLWLDPEVWPVDLTVQAAIRILGKTVFLQVGDDYPSAQYYINASVRTRSMTYRLKYAIPTSDIYTLPVTNFVYGTLPNGKSVAGYFGNWYVADELEIPDGLASGWGTTVTSGDYRVVWSGVSLLFSYGDSGDGNTRAEFKFGRVGASFDAVTAIQRIWRCLLTASLTITGHWQKWRRIGGVWTLMTENDYSQTYSHRARYQRVFTHSDVADFNPTGAYDFSESFYPHSSDFFDFYRDDVLSVTGRSF